MRIHYREAEEAANDVTKLGHMGNFYKNLMKKNVAFGAATAPAAESTSQGSAKAAGAGAAAAAAEDTAAAPAAGAGACVSGQQEGSRDMEEQAEARAAAADDAGPRRAPGTAAVSSRETSPARDRQAIAPPGSGEQVQMASPSGKGIAAAPTDAQQAGGAEPGTSAATGTEAEAAEAGESATVGGKRRNDEDAVAAARARYLARRQRVK